MTALDERSDEPAVSLKTWIAVGGGLLGAFLAVLNIQITNASLPYMKAALVPAASMAPGYRPPI
jgi:MFS transporter, DHA2 family, multidrug resistance protein